MSDRWRRRRRRYYEWLNRFDRADKARNNLDEMFRRVFGNLGENEKASRSCSSQLDSLPVFHTESSQIGEESEPLIDVFENEESVVVVAELIGIDKSSIDLHATEDKLMISIDSAEHKYDRQIELPARVDLGSSSSKLKNGILEIRLKKLRQELVLR